MLSFMVKIINICVGISVYFVILAPSATIYYASKSGFSDLTLYIVTFIYHVSLPTLLDHIKGKQINEDDILFNTIWGTIASILVILIGFSSYDPWSTRVIISSIAAYSFFIYKIAIKKE